MDLSPIISPGVYILRNRGRVVFVGAGRSPLARIYAHSTQRRGAATASYLPARPVIFDSIEIRPCTVDALAATYAEVCAELLWSPPVKAQTPQALYA